ncbi:hypothetical protein GWK47_030159 [Chionoecetes opilio]|uniref:Uncharacterized protein n=1 Tax=Chionoecetes opilio TaxID=41210 RepID=A0A8J5D1Q1_CHIOP|nr:hypothetical protein GWK47_030159 [Chionoecetes opilio]
MPPAASRYCYCVCDKKRRKHPGVRLQLFPKLLEAPLASAEIGLDVAAGRTALPLLPEIWHTLSEKDINNECFQVCAGASAASSMVPPPAAPVTSPHIHAVEGTPIRSLLRNTIYRLRMRIQQMGREAVRTPHQLIATAANFLAPEICKFPELRKRCWQLADDAPRLGDPSVWGLPVTEPREMISTSTHTSIVITTNPHNSSSSFS